MAEVKSLETNNLETAPDGHWIEYTPAKQRKEVKKSRFHIPANLDNPAHCYASHVKTYIASLKEQFGVLGGESELFKTCLPGGGYTKKAMGINLLYKIPGKVATQLKLESPESYTGHSFRRSSATQLANAGATSTDMRRFYHWQSDATANQYIDKSVVHGQRIGNMITGSRNDVSVGPTTTTTAASTVVAGALSSSQEIVQTSTQKMSVWSRTRLPRRPLTLHSSLGPISPLCKIQNFLCECAVIHCSFRAV
jgi:hypothetical protein